MRRMIDDRTVVDQQDKAVDVRALVKRARVEGNEVYLGLLNDRLKWNNTHYELQDIAIQIVAQRLESAFEFVETRVYSRGEQRHRLATFKHVQTGYLMNLLPGGAFKMGSENGHCDERPVHEVTITKPFLLGKYAVSQKVWTSMGDNNPSNFKGEDRPVEQVSWEDVDAWVKKAGLRLPGEAEWEYASRAGSTTAFSFGDTITPEQVNYNGKYPYGNAAKGLYREKTVDVGSLPGNAFGLHEMHGNVWEWCRDGWIHGYDSGPNNELPREPSGASSRVSRGGSWNRYAWSCRSAFRHGYTPVLRHYILGFRAAQEVLV